MNADLNEKQSAFVREYLVDLNATQAAIRAGYSERSAPVIACKLLTKDKVREAVEAGKRLVVQETGLTKARLVEQLIGEFNGTLGGVNPQAVARLGELLARMHGYIDDKPQPAQQLVQLIIQR